MSYGSRLCAATLRGVASRPGHESVGYRCFDNRHCEEPLRRSNPDCVHGGILDCFAALAMTVVTVAGTFPLGRRGRHGTRPCAFIRH
ncbi:hypothetical protein EAS61_15950 [Bradyrhizobium zhanjiangense]|uniref:Uncharacterized protein n=1 Tax=Bradyrhizobium zhanjiangense TaxID=1325107 RepID=A0A4Q0QQL8_9BRAD|nr:hypothetical protein EAS61_15950 [Bradyrhizobium zhanjiangense]